jgi:hypothetical protein
LDDGFTRRNQRELREAVDHIGFLGREVIVGVEAFYFRAAPKPEVETVSSGDGPDAAAALAQPSLKLDASSPQSANNADSGYDDSTHQDAAGAVSPAAPL